MFIYIFFLMFMNFVKRYVVFISYIEYIYIIKCQKDILVDFTKKKNL